MQTNTTSQTMPLPVATAKLDANTSACLAVYDEIDHVRVAQDALTNGSFTDDEMLILCDDQEFRKELYARQFIVNGPRNNGLVPYLAGGGAVVGALIFGAGGLIVGTGAAIAGFVIGAVAGGVVGSLLTIDSGNRQAANRLYDSHEDRFGEGKVGVAVVLRGDNEIQQARLQEASTILAAAAEAE